MDRARKEGRGASISPNSVWFWLTWQSEQQANCEVSWEVSAKRMSNLTFSCRSLFHYKVSWMWTGSEPKNITTISQQEDTKKNVKGVDLGLMDAFQDRWSVRSDSEHEMSVRPVPRIRFHFPLLASFLRPKGWVLRTAHMHAAGWLAYFGVFFLFWLDSSNTYAKFTFELVDVYMLRLNTYGERLQDVAQDMERK